MFHAVVGENERNQEQGSSNLLFGALHIVMLKFHLKPFQKRPAFLMFHLEKVDLLLMFVGNV